MSTRTDVGPGIGAHPTRAGVAFTAPDSRNRDPQTAGLRR